MQATDNATSNEVRSKEYLKVTSLTGSELQQDCFQLFSVTVPQGQSMTPVNVAKVGLSLHCSSLSTGYG